MIRLFLLINLLAGVLAVNAQHSIELRQTEKQRLDSSITEYYSPSMSWYNYSKNEYTYDSDQRLILDLEYLENPANNGWHNYIRREYTYDQYGNQISLVKHLWDTDLEQWTGQYGFSHTFTYDENGNRTQFFYDQWDNDTQEWVEYLWYEYEYDDNDRLVSTVMQRWAGSGSFYGWFNDRKYENTYDNDGNIIQEISYKAYPAGWRNYTKIDHTYSPDNTRLSEKYEWEIVTEQWIASDYHDETYDDNDNLIEKISYEKGSTNQWILYASYEYIYDENNNRIVNTINSQWDTNTEQWGSIGKYEYNYDNAYTYDDLILPDVNPELFRHKQESYILYVQYVNWPELMPSARETYFYSSIELTSNEYVSEVPILIFPNPANDVITFDLKNPTTATIILRDVQGKYISTQTLQNNQLPVNQLDSGVYFYELFYEEKMFGGKFIVK